MRPSQIVGTATKIVKRRVVQQKEMGLGSYLIACPGKFCTQKRNLKRQKLSMTNLLTTIIYLLVTQYLQESTINTKVQCCFTSTETGRQGAKQVPSPVMVVPLLYTPNSSTIISCKHWLLALLFGTTQSGRKRHKCCLNVFISSIQFSSFIRSMGHFQLLSFPREHFTSF